MDNTEVVVNNKALDAISQETWFSNKQIEVLKNTVFNTLKTESQVILALKVAQKYDLDVFAKEFWAFQDNTWKLISIASASWFMKIARRQPWFISIEAHAVYEWEEFKMNTSTWEVTHIIDLSARKPKKDWEVVSPIGAYARLRMQGKPDQVKFAEWSQYQKMTTKFNSPWNINKNAMIEKVSVTLLCREAFGLSWIYGEEETDNLVSSGQFATSNEADRESTMKAIEEKERKMQEMGKEAQKDEVVEAEIIK